MRSRNTWECCMAGYFFLFANSYSSSKFFPLASNTIPNCTLKIVSKNCMELLKHFSFKTANIPQRHQQKLRRVLPGVDCRIGFFLLTLRNFFAVHFFLFCVLAVGQCQSFERYIMVEKDYGKT